MRRKLTAACNAFTLGLGMLVTLFLGGPAGALPTAFEVAAAGDIAKDPDDIGIANPTTSDWHAYYLNQQQVATQVHGFVGNGTDAYVFPLGDNQYVSGSGPDYKGNLTAKNDNGNGEHEGPFGGSYHNNTNSNGAGEYAWGDFKSFTRPVAGNGDWKNNADTNDFANILGYKDYFGESLVTNAQGEPWYKITIDLQGGADWQWFFLDSTTCVVPGTNELCENDDGAGSENQYEWLQGQLSGDQGDCVGASFHHPVWSSSTAGEPQDMGPIYDLLDDAGGVDIVLSGHRHSYERFPKQSINLSTHLPFLEGDAPKQFVVGTGGEGTNDVISPAQLNSQLQIEAHGGLMLTLHAHDFEYSFDPIESNPETVPAGHADDDVTPAMINCTNDD